MTWVSSNVWEAVRQVASGFLVAFGLMCGCRSESAAPNPSEPSVTSLEPIGPVITGWEEQLDGISCRHSAVEANCSAEWCRIPAGCFIMGSPDSEPWRGEQVERLTAVTLTHPFEIGQFEVTQKQWSELVMSNPSRPDNEMTECLEPRCPVGHVTWFEAIQFSNILSEKHDPPLKPCFALAGCQGEMGRGMVCAMVTLNASTVYECEGYRLPTEAEWEYAVRAGTRTAYYSGDVTVAQDGIPDSNLDPIAWYGPNAAKTTHPVGTKRPNRWMLFDMLGNVKEWVIDHPIFADPQGPLTDPLPLANPPWSDTLRVTRGGRVTHWPKMLRAAGRLYSPWDTAGQGFGFRLVRTVK